MEALDLWRRVSEPHRVKVEFFCIYLPTIDIGCATLLVPPRTIEGALGDTLTTVWACSLIIGGSVGAVATLPGFWWVERLGIFAIIIGIVIYLATVVYLHFDGDGNRLTQSGFITLALLLLALRWQGIWKYSYEPRG